MKIMLVDRTPALARAWRGAFEAPDEDADDGAQEDEDVAGRSRSRRRRHEHSVEVFEDDYFAHPADAMVSPANSFGIMDGGLDLAIRDQLGLAVQRRAQRIIIERHHGELPVGCAELVETGDVRWPSLIIAPTMRVPESVGHTLNAYLAFRAILLVAERANLGSIVCCGLATGIGAMEPQRAAVQMRMALLHVMGPARIPSFSQIHATHHALRTA